MGSSAPHQRVVVLGSDGFIGSHLVEALLRAGRWQVVGWDRELSRTAGLVGQYPSFVFRRLDLRDDRDRLDADIAEADVVVNLAALCNPSLYTTRTVEVIESNFLDVEPIVRRCAQAGTRLVHLSTSEVFGRTVRSWLPDAALDPASPLEVFHEEDTPFLLGPLASSRWSYACAKQLSERLVEAYGRERGLAWTIVRPFNFIGPRMDYLPGWEGEGTPRVLACFLAALLSRQPLRLVDGGRSRRAFLHVSEAVDALVRILELPARCDRKVFHLGNPANETDIRSLALAMRRIWADIRQDPSVLDIPLQDVTASEFYGEGYDDSDRRMPSIVQARQILQWEPRMGLEEALVATLSDYHSRFPKETA
ncbi:MAG TPA: NAD-dependent epimerase/dehydratase family protein [Fibrobacteria bacterium]|nr:NAD-dependent epimerase/dehydratase family protein [Fibrobacteria bacterium]HOX49960.1 NAD-dependent epimerase/dehydratase family protein [Fibrobacteria bacterium]